MWKMIWLRCCLILTLCNFVNSLIPLRNPFDPFDVRPNSRSFSNRFRSGKFPKDGPTTNDTIERVCQIFKYELRIIPYMDFPNLATKQNMTFDATMSMFFQITNMTSYLPLRSENLVYNSLKLRRTGSKNDLILNAFETDFDTTNAKIIPLEGFEIGTNYTLLVEYSGKIYDSSTEDWPEGLYYDSYTTPDGKSKQIVATFFEPTNARKVFPGLDDPYFKAVFSLELIYPRGYKVYANTDIIESRQWDTTYRDYVKFADTPPISSYLFAFSLGEFAEATNTTKNNVKVRAMSIPHLNAGLQDAANIGTGCVNAMEDLTKVKFFLKKLDNVDMLTMGYAEAMENPGMIVYAQNLIRHPKISGAPYRLLASSILCHEIGHQWFGDLVTNDHWGVEFLHEGFANFFEKRAFQWQINAEDTNYMETKFVVDREYALFDASHNFAHPIVDNISNFDSITYQGGGAILRMLEAALGSDTFYKALKIYLTKNAYGNADQNTLIDAFEEALGYQTVCGDLTITQVMNDFLMQLHNPIVTVGLENNQYTFSQHSSNKTDNQTTWNIPLFVWEGKSKKVNVIWLLSDSSICTNDGFKLDPKVAYVFNYRAFSYARIHHSFNSFNQLFMIDSTLLDGATQLGIIFDQLNKEEMERDTSTGDDRATNRLLKKFMTDANGLVDPYLIERYIRVYPDDNLTSYKVYQKVDLNTKSLTGGIYNLALSKKAAQYGSAALKQEGQRLFNQFVTDCSNAKDGALVTCNKIPADARPFVYCIGIIGKDKPANTFLKNYKTSVGSATTVYAFLADEYDVVKNVIRDCAS